MLPFSETAVAPLTKGQVSYKRRSHCKVSCSKPYVRFFSGETGTGPIQAPCGLGAAYLLVLLKKSFPLSSFIKHFPCVGSSVEK